MQWAEELPPNCPPTCACPPNGEAYYRIVNQFPPTVEDFYSNRKIYPEKPYNNECRARAVSLFKDLEECRNVQKLPTQKGKNCIAKINLMPNSGVVLQTGVRISHYSWWSFQGYNPIKDCVLVP